MSLPLPTRISAQRWHRWRRILARSSGSRAKYPSSPASRFPASAPATPPATQPETPRPIVVGRFAATPTLSAPSQPQQKQQQQSSARPFARAPPSSDPSPVALASQRRRRRSLGQGADRQRRRGRHRLQVRRLRSPVRRHWTVSRSVLYYATFVLLFSFSFNLSTILLKFSVWQLVYFIYINTLSWHMCSIMRTLDAFITTLDVLSGCR